MPRGVYDRTPSEVFKLKRQIGELQARLKDLQNNEEGRKALAAVIKKHRLTRGHLYEAINKMPKMRITKKARLKRLAEAQGHDVRPGRKKAHASGGTNGVSVQA